MLAKSDGATALAHIYSRESRFFVQHSDRTRLKEAGFWVGSSEVKALSHAVSDDELGTAILDALGRSQLEVALPTSDDNAEVGLFRAMGVRSRRASYDGTKACSIEIGPTELQAYPLINGGASTRDRGYYQRGPEHTVSLPLDAAATVVGETVRRLLNESVE